jgi:cobalt-zinc-cadmium efflux system outer membrane protein
VPLVFSGRLGKAESAAQAARDVAALTYVCRRREALAETQRAFMTVLSTRRALELTRESRDLARTARDVAEERLRAQAVPEMEALKTAVALSKAEIELKRAERDAAGALKALHAAMGDPDFPVAKVTGELAAAYIVPSLDTLRGLATGAHPRVAAASKAKEAAELEVAVARAERIPDPHLEVLAGRDPEDASIIEAGISIPFPLFNRNQAKIAKTEARVRQAEHEFDAVRNDLLLKLGESHRAIGTAQEAVAIYRDDILPKAEKALAQTSEGYRLGKFGYLDLLDAQRTLAEARSAYAAALTELNLAAVELEKLSGLKLERRSP